MLVENGGTVVIGGIYLESQAEDETKVPLFGDLPVVGNLFKSKVEFFQQQDRNDGVYNAQDDF